MRLQPRDIRLLEDLYGYGCMLRSQIQTLHFGSVQRANARLLQLFQAGYIVRAEMPIPTSQGVSSGYQFAYLLGSKAIPYVAATTGIDPELIRQQLRKGTPGYLLHTIEIVNFRLSVETAARSNPEIELIQFVPERLCRHSYRYRLHEQGAETWHTEVYKPDAVVLLSSRGQKSGYSVEIDLGHTNSKEFMTKLQIHTRYSQTPELFENRYGMKKKGILVITTGSLRKANLLSLAEKTDCKLVRITTFDELRKLGAFEKIWSSIETTGAICQL